MWDAQQFCDDYHIESFPESTQGGPNWLNICCPMGCGDHSDHGKFHLGDGGYHCWKCGSHKPEWIIHVLTGIPYRKSKEIFLRYNRDTLIAAKGTQKVHVANIDLIGGPLEKQHKWYLLSRGIDPIYVEDVWGVLGTPIAGEMRNRIVFPFYMHGRPVTYQTRDMYEKSYKMLSPDKSVIPAKHLLYGEWLLKDKQLITVCEGPFDAINMGVGFVATCGTGHTMQQIKRLKVYEKVYTLYDPEPEAQKRALKLVKDLSILGVDAIQVEYSYKGDPGELTKDQVNKIRKELGYD